MLEAVATLVTRSRSRSRSRSPSPAQERRPSTSPISAAAPAVPAPTLSRSASSDEEEYDPDEQPPPHLVKACVALANANGYDLGRRVGHSGFSEVRLLLDRTLKSAKCVGKFYVYGAGETGCVEAAKKQHFLRELCALRQLGDASHVLRMVDQFSNANDDLHCVVTGYVGCEDLFAVLQRRRRLTERETVILARSVFTGLRDMHDRGVVHADIKLENVYLPDVVPSFTERGRDAQFEGAVIGDFGLAGVTRTETDVPSRPSHHQKYFRGTTEYLAPEVAARLSPPHPPSDVWSAALTCFVALTGTHPFQQIRDYSAGRQLRTSFRGSELIQLIALHQRTKERIKSTLCVMPDVSGKALSFFLRAMRLSPWDRPTADECLHNPWLAAS